jgi:hypothetical protein
MLTAPLQATARKLAVAEEALRTTQRKQQQETESLLRKLKEVEQSAVDLEVEVQAKEHKLTLLGAKADSQERKATQKIASLKDILANQIKLLDDKMGAIVEMKNQTATFVHEALAVFQVRHRPAVHTDMRDGRGHTVMKKLRIVALIGISGWSEAVSRRPPIPLDTIVARTHMYTYDAEVRDLSIVQGPFSAAPCRTRYDSQLFRRGRTHHPLPRPLGAVVEQGCTPLARDIATRASPPAGSAC